MTKDYTLTGSTLQAIVSFEFGAIDLSFYASSTRARQMSVPGMVMPWPGCAARLVMK
jgi:hypothetical protein